MSKAAWLGFLALALAGCERRPDVVFITLDTLRVDHVGAFNPDSPAKTPHIDSLAAEGIVYTNAWSPISVTGPAFCTLLTGREPGTHTVTMNLFRGGQPLPEEEQTLAEVLGAEGWSTGGFVSGFTLQSKLRLRQGFDRYTAPGAKLRRRMGDATANWMWWWLSLQPAPVFAWYHSYDAHGPLSPWEEPAITPDLQRGGPDLERIPRYQRIENISDLDFFKARYATAVEFADAQVGTVLDQLRATGRYDNAVIVFTADHGESFDERALWLDHGTHASPEQLHVPLIVRYPDGRGAGSRNDELVGLSDVMPTMLAYLGIDSDIAFDGRSLLDDGRRERLTGESSHCKNEKPLQCAPHGYGGKRLAVRDDARAVHRIPTEDGVVIEVYDRTRDPLELEPLAPDSALAAVLPPEEAVLSAMLARRIALTPDETPAEAPKTRKEQEELEALQALGYVDGP